MGSPGGRGLQATMKVKDHLVSENLENLNPGATAFEWKLPKNHKSGENSRSSEEHELQSVESIHPGVRYLTACHQKPSSFRTPMT